MSAVFTYASDYEITDIYRNDRENFGFKGKVDVVIHQTGKPGKDLKFFSDAMFYSEEFLQFNESGFCSFIRFKDLSSDEVTVENVFSYHSQTGQRLMFAIYGRDSVEIFRKVFRYDSNGKVVKEEITYPRKSSKPVDTVDYIYDESGNPIKKTTKKTSTGQQRSVEFFVYDAGGSLLSKETVAFGDSGKTRKTFEKWEYNAGGQKTDYEISGEGKTENTKYSYTDDGKIQEEIRYINGKQQFRKVYHYEDGICTAELVSDGEDRLTSITRLWYDTKGNWIQKVTYRFGENSKRVEVYQIEKREIRYRR